jgi:crotonobetainyl-CoA:carnitine CoA-transferase CaiB-like acyl-CoA transferase
VELAERLGLQPRVSVGDGDREVDLVRNPITFSAAAPRYSAPPPLLGEHSHALREWLTGTS